ncbi:xylulokinase [Fodinisporobacter ferrooxydans]|uniref:Xylulose kinase n=1 Tax=Fodinisporobacter ferrooxydans TaxID=2901836 RepID=A0ABY4CKP8_9BACL|nr:xylulokinase [Alicyclobacillaceae bacterium MYW30-H2]
MAYVLGVDVGTEGTKVIVIDQKGDIVQKAYRSYAFETPQSGWTEQDPDIWWQAFVACLQELWRQGIQPSEVAGIGVAGQMHSSVLLNRQGQVIRKAILWNDVRTKNICEQTLQSIGASRYQGETCNSLLPGFTLGKLLWIKEQEPEIFQQIDKVLMPKDFINFKLTNLYSADVSDASGTGVFDVRNRTWNKGLIGELDLPMHWFPDVYESGEIAGEVAPEAAEITGLPAGTAVIAGTADNAGAAVGMGIVTKERGLVSIGTSGVVLACLDTPPTYEEAIRQNPTLHVFCHGVPNMWYGMGVTLSAGASLRWFRDSLGHGDSYDALMMQAGTVDAGSNGLLYLPFLNGERTPYNSDKIRAGFLGMNLQHQGAHFARSVIEGVSYSLRDCLELIRLLPNQVQEFVVTGGVAKSELWLQVLCDVLATSLRTVGYAEGAAYGAGILAGVAQGFWGAVGEVFQEDFLKRSFAPSEQSRHYQEGFEQYKRLIQALLHVHD